MAVGSATVWTRIGGERRWPHTLPEGPPASHFPGHHAYMPTKEYAYNLLITAIQYALLFNVARCILFLYTGLHFLTLTRVKGVTRLNILFLRLTSLILGTPLIRARCASTFGCKGLWCAGRSFALGRGLR